MEYGRFKLRAKDAQNNWVEGVAVLPSSQDGKYEMLTVNNSRVPVYPGTTQVLVANYNGVDYWTDDIIEVTDPYLVEYTTAPPNPRYVKLKYHAIVNFRLSTRASHNFYGDYNVSINRLGNLQDNPENEDYEKHTILEFRGVLGKKYIHGVGMFKSGSDEYIVMEDGSHHPVVAGSASPNFAQFKSINFGPRYPNSLGDIIEVNGKQWIVALPDFITGYAEGTTMCGNDRPIGNKFFN